ncbi:MAG: radical SAM protein [Anaerolineaceae bacterium]
MKERFRTFFNNIFFTPKPFPPGNYQAIFTSESGAPLRLHLRVENDGMGILILNASTILHLNPTATEIAYHLIQKTPEETVFEEMSKRYRVEDQVIREDFQNFKERINSLINSPDLDPETFLDVERLELHAKNITAPLRLDCALTYQLSNGEASIYAPANRVTRNLDTNEWRSILEKSWQIGIPHIVFTGGEPTLRPDIPELIACAEQLGQVTGLITDGLRFTEKDYLHQLLQAGLDHVLIILSPEDEQSWEALRDVLLEDIFTTVHITVSEKNSQDIGSLLTKLHNLKVNSLSLSADSPATHNLMTIFQQKASELGFSLVWDLPVPYSKTNPISIELEEEEAQKEGAGRTWLYIEPDGDVLPGQGKNEVLGNILTDPWEGIWLKATHE